MSVGVDAALSPAARNRKIAHTTGETVKYPVGADASVRPLGNGEFAATWRKNGRAACGSIWASTPTNGVRGRIGAFVFVGAYRRADRVVRPYGCIPFRIGAPISATLYRAGGVEPLPYADFADSTRSPMVRTILLLRAAQSLSRLRRQLPLHKGALRWAHSDGAPKRGGSSKTRTLPLISRLC